MVTFGIAADEPRAIGKPCASADYDEVFVIPVAQLRSEKYRTVLSVDVTDTNGIATITPGAKVLQQKVFKDSFPRIAVTLFENP